MRNWLKDKYVVLSGASGGIGRQLCKLLVLKYGAKVIGIGRNENKMRSLQEELGKASENFSYALFDVGEQEGWAQLKARLLQENVNPILLINNAGAFPTFSKTLNVTPQTAERIMRTNYYSIVYATTELSPLLQGDNRIQPGIVNVSSCAALCTVAGTGVYSASKAAVKGYTEALQIEERGKKYVGIIYPGTTKTELFSGDEHTQNSALDYVAMSAEKMAKKIARKIVKRKARAVIGLDAKLMSGTAKWFSTLGLRMIGGVMKASKSKVFTKVFDRKDKKK